MNTPANSNRVECSDCGTLLDESKDTPELRAACPYCGSSRRTVHVAISESAVARDGIGMKAKRPGERRPYVESRSVPSHSVRKGKLVHREQVIDRDNDLYYEKVTDYESGEIIHENEEPLSKHTGRGSAKPKVPKNDA